MKDLEIGAIYKHYKSDHTYQLIGIARHSETLEEMVVYKAQYESPEFGKDCFWVRPKLIFEDNVIVNGQEVERFKKIN